MTKEILAKEPYDILHLSNDVMQSKNIRICASSFICLDYATFSVSSRVKYFKRKTYFMHAKKFRYSSLCQPDSVFKDKYIQNEYCIHLICLF